MIKKIKELYQCDECKLLYKDISWAKKCETWDKKNNSCNLEITNTLLKSETELFVLTFVRRN